MKKLLIFAMLLTMSACAYVDPSITDQTKIYYDSPVRRSTLQVSVHPKGKQFRPLTAYFPAMVVQQQTTDYNQVGNAFGQIFHNVWMEERLFPILEYDGEARYQGLTYAMRNAKSRGADLLILGRVPYFYAGHTVDDSAVTIQMDIYSVKTGQRLWTMMQSGRIEDKFPDDYFYFQLVNRLPDSPFNKIIRSIAKDMAVPLKAWLPDPDAQYQFADSTSAVRKGLTEPPTKTPPNSAQADTQKDGKMEGEGDLPVERSSTPGINLNILFDFNKATIRKDSYPQLDALGEVLNSPELKGKRIIIGGHTDTQGDAAANMALSKKRAEAVINYIVKKWKVDPSLIEAVGYGESRPIDSEETKAGRQRNRRVEVRIAE